MFVRKKIGNQTYLAMSIVFLAIVVRMYFWFQIGYTWEDALITIRYVRNIIQGNGFVYNLGERVLGTTTPGYTLLLAFLGKTYFC